MKDAKGNNHAGADDDSTRTRGGQAHVEEATERSRRVVMYAALYAKGRGIFTGEPVSEIVEEIESVKGHGPKPAAGGAKGK